MGTNAVHNIESNMVLSFSREVIVISNVLVGSLFRASRTLNLVEKTNVWSELTGLGWFSWDFSLCSALSISGPLDLL